MPIGYLVSVLILALCTSAAVAPRRPRRSGPSSLSYRLGFLVNELPFVAFFLLLASTLLAYGQGDIDSPVGWTGFGLAVLTALGLMVVVLRALRAKPAIDDALTAGLGADWSAAIDASMAARLRSRIQWARIVLVPFVVRRHDVERVADISYGDAGTRNMLDVYRHRSHPQGGPMLVHLHGGAFRSGHKNRETRPLLYRLASQGWVCISANYRLSPAARFPDHLIDVKKVIAWAREHGAEYGGDAAVMFVAGSSAGGHLAAMAGLTPNHTMFQPGFEQADTSVTGVISLYGYYGGVDSDRQSPSTPSSPAAYVAADAPPFFVTHGDHDTVVAVEDARALVALLRAVSSSAVVYAELPGAQHAFDVVHSVRFDHTVNAIEAFTAWVRSRPMTTKP
jgi:acetyl esterase/lipase